MDREHRTIRVTGRVQGVLFRKNTQRTAEGLGLTGFVTNNPDGSVTIEAEGDPARLDELIRWCHEGPRSAAVTHVEVESAGLKHYTDFRVV